MINLRRNNIRLVIFPLFLVLVSCSGGTNNESNPSPEIPNSSDKVSLDRTAIVAGTDNDRNGVRDDVDKIIKKISAAPDQQGPLTEVAKSFQDMLVKAQDASAIDIVFNKMEASIRCLSSKSAVYEAQTNALYAATVNTEERYLAERTFQNNLRSRVDEFTAEPACQ